MTSEDDFQAALDANPADWQTRLVFADWLEERNDPRAAGYRAMGLLRRHPLRCVQSDSKKVHFIVGDRDRLSLYSTLSVWKAATIPAAWYALCPKGDEWANDEAAWKYYNTRRRADDGVALAFAEVSAAQRDEFLADPPFVPDPKPKKRKS